MKCCFEGVCVYQLFKIQNQLSQLFRYKTFTIFHFMSLQSTLIYLIYQVYEFIKSTKTFFTGNVIKKKDIFNRIPLVEEFSVWLELVL